MLMLNTDKSFAICGAINPMKPILPETATHALTSPILLNSKIDFSLSTETPKLVILVSSN